MGIVGYGALGKFLCERIESEAKDVEIVFVWNRTPEKIPPQFTRLDKLEDFAKHCPDLVVEVAHPVISQKYGGLFLSYCDFYAGSPTAFADPETFRTMEGLARNPKVPGSLYVPVGALWGAEDIQRMADQGKLEGLKVTMRKHPLSLKLESPLREKIAPLIQVDGASHARSRTGEQKEKDSCTDDRCVVVYSGSVRDLCPLAPNNVNTMACAAIAGHTLGFDGTQCELLADLDLPDRHDIDIEVQGPGGFSVKTTRSNPAVLGAVTGQQTYVTFYNSLLRARGRGPGVFFC